MSESTTDRRWSEADVERYATFITGHPDATPDARHLAATRAVLGGLAADGRLLADPQELERLRKVERERDSLARRCALRYEETERLRAELAETTADRDGRQRLIEAQGRVQLGHEATIRELRARVAELEQQLWQLRDAMTDQHEAVGHALAVHAWAEECPGCFAAADRMDGELACEQWQRWQASYEAAMALRIGPRPPSPAPPYPAGGERGE